MRSPYQRRSGLRAFIGSGEHVEFESRQHPFALVRSLFDAMGLIVPLLLAAWGISGIKALDGAAGDWAIRLMFLIMLGIVAKLFWRLVCWEFERVMVTSEQVIHIHGVIHRRIASTPLAKVSEFSVYQPLLGRIFGYGALVVDVPGGREQALHGMDYLPEPAALYRLVSDIARSERRGVEVDSPVLDISDGDAQMSVGDQPTLVIREPDTTRGSR